MSEGNGWQGMQKIPRYSRGCIITEKIDGTNGQIFIWDENYRPKLPNGKYGDVVGFQPFLFHIPWLATFSDHAGPVRIAAGSKKQWLTPEKDNFGFARWVKENANALTLLGHGRHYGEWWGHGIQRNYGLKEKRFSLFNVTRWNTDVIPGVCHVVPKIFEGPFTTNRIVQAMIDLAQHGSYAAPGFMNPEGVVIFHTAGNYLFKKTFLHDEGKGDGA